MLAHQLAAAHHASMAMTAQLSRCIENMEHHDPDARERANIQGTRLAQPQPTARTDASNVRLCAQGHLMGANSGELGDIERVVESNADKKQFLIIGGLLGSV
jgi:hypothetical protein